MNKKRDLTNVLLNLIKIAIITIIAYIIIKAFLGAS